MKTQSFKDLLVDQLRDLYNAEQQLTSALPKMARAATSPRLVDAFEGHAKETLKQVNRLAQIFEVLEQKPKGKTCKAMQGLIKESEEAIDMLEDWAPEVVDAALIVAAQKVEHYEIAGYGSMRTFAQILGEKDVVELLQETLDEEANADKALSEIAAEVNADANEVASETASAD